MSIRQIIKRRRFTVVAATITALAAGGVAAIASIPGQTGVFYGCHSGSGSWMRVIDAEAGGSCPYGYKQVTWNQRGPTGPRGQKGDTGPKGDPGPIRMHWVRLRADSTSQNVIAASEPGTQVWNGGVGRRYILWNGVDIEKCSVTVSAVNDNPANAYVTSFQRIVGYYLYAQVDKVNANGTTTPVDAELNIEAACNQDY